MTNNEIWTGNNIGDEGAIMISESLKTNTSLTELDLRGDDIEVANKTEEEIEKELELEKKNENKKWIGSEKKI